MPIKTNEEEQNKNLEKSTLPNRNPCPILYPIRYRLTRPAPRGMVSRSSSTNRALTDTNCPISLPTVWLGPSRLKRNKCKAKRNAPIWGGLRSERGKVGREGSMAAGLVQIGDGSVEEERRVYGGRKKRWRGNKERDMGKWNAKRIKNKKVMWMQNIIIIFFLALSYSAQP